MFERPWIKFTRQLGGEEGETLIELLIASAIAVVVLSAIGSVLVVSEVQTQKEQNYGHALNSTVADLDHMVANIRQAWNILASSGNSVDMEVNVLGSPVQVEYQCDFPATKAGYQECVTRQAPVGSPLPASWTVLIPQITNGTTQSPVFKWSPSAISPNYMSATVDVPASDGASSRLTLNHTIAFSDGALMRNENVQN